MQAMKEIGAPAFQATMCLAFCHDSCILLMICRLTSLPDLSPLPPDGLLDLPKNQSEKCQACSYCRTLCPFWRNLRPDFQLIFTIV